MMKLMRLILILWGILISSFAAAHEMRPALLELTELQPGKYQVLWKVPARGGESLSIAPQLPSRCTNVSAPNGIATPEALVQRWMVDCGPGGLAGSRLTIRGLVSKQTDVMMVQRTADGHAATTLVKPDQPWLEIGREPSSLETARRYTLLGVENILFGIDHLLFVFGLLLLVRGVRPLVNTITSFTVARTVLPSPVQFWESYTFLRRR